MRVAHPRFNHKGGQVQFGPDGMLYAAFGDGGGGGDPDDNAQNLGRILGKMVRIEPLPNGGYAIPADNPFATAPARAARSTPTACATPTASRSTGAPAASRSATSARTPSRRSTTCRAAGRGAPPRGGYNFGWDVFEGRDSYEGGRAPGHVPPVIAHSQDGGFCSIIGGYVIRDRSLGRGWTGRYIYGDYCNSVIRLAG